MDDQVKPYIFLLRRKRPDNTMQIHSSWIGYQVLPECVVHHEEPFHKVKRELVEHGYQLQRLA